MTKNSGTVSEHQKDFEFLDRQFCSIFIFQDNGVLLVGSPFVGRITPLL